MSSRALALFSSLSLQLLGFASVVSAQQHFKLGGGAGFASLENPEIDHGRTAAVGGFIGFRFNDNVSLETGFNFARSSRFFDEEGTPVDERRSLPDFQFQANRYNLDATFVVHLGRRQPFHPFLFAGAGVQRRDEKRTDIEFTIDPETNQITDRVEEVVFESSEYEPEGHVGAGFDLYFLYNLAARVEFRLRLPQTTDKRTRMFLFGATYFF